MPLRQTWVSKRKSSRLVTFKKIELQPHQKHEVLFFNYHRNVLQHVGFVLDLLFVKSQGKRHTSAATAFDSNAKEIVRRDVFIGHNVLDLSLCLGGYFYGDHLELKNRYEQGWVLRYLQNYSNAEFYDNKEI